MSGDYGRSGYSDSLEQWDLIRWRGAVKSALRGKRGQAFLRELAESLDAMPEKRLISHDLERPDGEVCALGCIGKARGLNMAPLETLEADDWAPHFGIAWAMTAEIAFMNDEGCVGLETAEHRWKRMRIWVGQQIKEADDV